MRYSYCFLLLFFILIFSSCRRESLLIFIKPPKKFAPQRVATAPDYKLDQHWHKPKKRFNNKEVDVFFVHPTTYIKARYWNQPLDDEHTNWRTKVLPIRYQASAFYEDCNTFIPKYRQAAFYSFADKKDNGKQALEIAYQDVKQAFYYYWKHHNNGRPFILAGHSQGSLHSQRLLKELMQDSTIGQQLIVAYLIGWPVEQNDVEEMSDMAVCTTASQVACLVSWNAQAPYAKRSMKDALGIQEEIVCVNPLTWTTDTTYASKTYNHGALMNNKQLGNDEVLIHYADAQIKEGLLIVNPNNGKQKLQMPLVKGNYHIYDYNFFYYNIKENIKERIEAYQQHRKIEYPQ
jgi:hypothetical protein